MRLRENGYYGAPIQHWYAGRGPENMVILTALMLAQAFPVPAPRQQENIRCVKDSFGNYTCNDGTRYLIDSFGNVIIIPPKK